MQGRASSLLLPNYLRAFGAYLRLSTNGFCQAHMISTCVLDAPSGRSTAGKPCPIAPTQSFSPHHLKSWHLDPPPRIIFNLSEKVIKISEPFRTLCGPDLEVYISLRRRKPRGDMHILQTPGVSITAPESRHITVFILNRFAGRCLSPLHATCSDRPVIYPYVSFMDECRPMWIPLVMDLKVAGRINCDGCGRLVNSFLISK